MPEEEIPADAFTISQRDHHRHAAVYIAADIAKAVPATNGGSVESRVKAVLNAADDVFEWLTKAAD